MPKKHRKNKEWCLAEDEKQRTQQNNIVMWCLLSTTSQKTKPFICSG
jgi:hypothetical protein